MNKITLTKEEKNQIIEQASYLSYRDICENLNINLRTFYRLLNEDEDLATNVRKAKTTTKLMAAKKYYHLMNQGNEKACRYFLRNNSINFVSLNLTPDSFKDLDEARRIILSELTCHDLSYDQAIKLVSVLNNSELQNDNNESINALRYLLNSEDKLQNKLKDIDEAIGLIESE